MQPPDPQLAESNPAAYAEAMARYAETLCTDRSDEPDPHDAAAYAEHHAKRADGAWRQDDAQRAPRQESRTDAQLGAATPIGTPRRNP